jgi:hypothetical protein
MGGRAGKSQAREPLELLGIDVGFPMERDDA